MLIIFEGIDGSGKTTLIKNVHNFLLTNTKNRTITTFEPGDTELGKKIRPILGDANSSLAQYFLFCADRIEHINQVILPNLESGNIVLCDRFVYSSYVYQGLVGGVDINFIQMVNDFISQHCTIALVFYCRVTYDIAIKRISQRKTNFLYDTASQDYMKALIAGFDYVFQDEKNTHILDANRSEEELLSDCLSIIKKYI